eukprot:3272919-Rhodomonas_salina.2
MRHAAAPIWLVIDNAMLSGASGRCACTLGWETAVLVCKGCYDVLYQRTSVLFRYSGTAVAVPSGPDSLVLRSYQNSTGGRPVVPRHVHQ